VFWPEAEAKADAAVGMVRFQRELTKKIDCNWWTSHHRRKTNVNNPVSLEDDKHRWFEEAAGSRALINHMDTRLGIEASSGGISDLMFAGFMRSVGWLEPRFLKRVHDEGGTPVGYDLVQGVGLLNPLFQEAYGTLLARFRFTDAKKALGGSSDSQTKSFLDQCQAVGLLRHESREYVKIQAVRAE
jgi:hypothetical protein